MHSLISQFFVKIVPDVVSTNCQLTDDVLTNCTHKSGKYYNQIHEQQLVDVCTMHLHVGEEIVTTMSWAIPLATVSLLVVIAVIMCLLLASKGIDFMYNYLQQCWYSYGFNTFLFNAGTLAAKLNKW